MEICITKTTSDVIEPLRILFLNEGGFQFICNKCHTYGWADTYLFTVDGTGAGYGAVWGSERREDRDTIFEFYLLPPYRGMAGRIFREFQVVCKAGLVESQTNDLLLTSMLYERTRNIYAEAILFEDHYATGLTVPGVSFRKRTEGDDMGDDDSTHVLIRDRIIVASGGLMLNYNMPYADIYMQVREPYRKQGLGALMVQELKKEAYRMNRVPAARCNIENPASKATLLKAGFRICGFRIKGVIKP
ncbi:GNAT family N-acetyltransferase [Niabella beijingensis]|uniref:GNAT family N-acetyltransferase n=1 Tax=Niabella beijingensis TaxID=2872700 RepID=UPI001CBBFBCD|nr:GNAT family N-acetyltransferase [Niabella beijingensis]MBZ4189235.1 GNAT family N-acetyltransferase [Niabella beijingensis]